MLCFPTGNNVTFAANCCNLNVNTNTIFDSFFLSSSNIWCWFFILQGSCSVAAAQCSVSGVSAMPAPVVYTCLFLADLCEASPLSFWGFWLSISFAASQFRTVWRIDGRSVVQKTPFARVVWLPVFNQCHVVLPVYGLKVLLSKALYKHVNAELNKTCKWMF
jgi:hypothetical protein